MKRSLMILCVLALVCAGTRSASAAPITINIGNFSGGVGQLHAPNTLANNLYVYLGAVVITGDLGTFESYCVDLQHYDIPGQNLATVDSMANWNNYAVPQHANLGGGAASWLYTTYSGVAAGNQAKQASLSLAIWNALYDNDFSVTGGSGFYADHLSADYATQANAWLGNLQSFMQTPGSVLPQARWLRTYDYGSNTAQDFIAPVPTPEPATLLLFGSGIAGIAAKRRRRKS